MATLLGAHDAVVLRLSQATVTAQGKHKEKVEVNVQQQQHRQERKNLLDAGGKNTTKKYNKKRVEMHLPMEMSLMTFKNSADAVEELLRKPALILCVLYDFLLLLFYFYLFIYHYCIKKMHNVGVCVCVLQMDLDWDGRMMEARQEVLPKQAPDAAEKTGRKRKVCEATEGEGVERGRRGRTNGQIQRGRGQSHQRSLPVSRFFLPNSLPFNCGLTLSILMCVCLLYISKFGLFIYKHVQLYYDSFVDIWLLLTISVTVSFPPYNSF